MNLSQTDYYLPQVSRNKRTFLFQSFTLYFFYKIISFFLPGSCAINHLRIGPGFYIEKCIHGEDYIKVCNSRWSENEARVACRGQGHCKNELCDVTSFQFIQSNSTVRTEMRKCNGAEDKLDNCTPILPSSRHNCSGKAFHVTCQMQGKVLWHYAPIKNNEVPT